MPKRKREEKQNESKDNDDGTLKRIVYKGVWISRKRYQANITIDGHRSSLGTYATPKAAAEAYDRAAIKEFRPIATLNFPNQVPANYVHKAFGRKPISKVRFKGITKRGKRFSAQVTMVTGKPKHLGSFDTAEQAAKAYDGGAIQEGYPTSKLNFPEEVPKNYQPKKKKKPKFRRRKKIEIPRKKGENKFQVEIQIDGKKKSLGFTTEETSIAVDLAGILA
jgi:hypothetical protein